MSSNGTCVDGHEAVRPGNVIGDFLGNRFLKTDQRERLQSLPAISRGGAGEAASGGEV